MVYEFVLLPFFTALLAAAVITPLSLIFIKKLGLFDDPKRHRHPAIIHKKPIPRGGGIPLFLAVILASILFLPVNNTTIAIFLAAFLALSIGILDDKLDISAYLRFFINILTAFIVVSSGITIPFITHPLGGILHLDVFSFSLSLFGQNIVIGASDIIAIVWIVWVMNMLNWSKGVDGQMPGVLAISAIVIGTVSLRFPVTDQNTLISTKLSFMIAGSAIGFLVYNFYPAKIFPGYGATAMYFLLAVVSILSGAKLATAILVMGVPMVDGIFTVGRRILTGHSPFRHDKKHLHHLLLRLGFSQRHIALFYWLFSAILGAISLTLSSQGKLFAIIMLVVVTGGALLTLHLVLRTHEQEAV